MRSLAEAWALSKPAGRDCAAAMAALLVAGFKHYVRLQYFMFAATAILVVILLVQFLRTSPEQ